MPRRPGFFLGRAKRCERSDLAQIKSRGVGCEVCLAEEQSELRAPRVGHHVWLFKSRPEPEVEKSTGKLKLILKEMDNKKIRDIFGVAVMPLLTIILFILGAIFSKQSLIATACVTLCISLAMQFMIMKG